MTIASTSKAVASLTRFFKHGNRFRILWFLISGLTLMTLVVVLGDEFSHHLHALEAYFERSGPIGIAVFIVLYALLCSMLVPETLLGIVAGVAFGFWVGVPVVIVGNIIAVSIQYVLAHGVLKVWMNRLVNSRPSLTAIRNAVRQDEWRLQFLIRMTPINRAMTSYVLGATGVRFVPFLVACVGFIPNLCLEIWFGHAGKQLASRTAQTGSTVNLHDVSLLAGLGVACVVLVVVSRIARRAVLAASVTSESV